MSNLKKKIKQFSVRLLSVLSEMSNDMSKSQTKKTIVYSYLPIVLHVQEVYVQSWDNPSCMVWSLYQTSSSGVSWTCEAGYSMQTPAKKQYR